MLEKLLKNAVDFAAAGIASQIFAGPVNTARMMASHFDALDTLLLYPGTVGDHYRHISNPTAVANALASLLTSWV